MKSEIKYNSIAEFGDQAVVDKVDHSGIIHKYIFALWLFPFYTERFRPRLAEIEKNVLKQTRGTPLYVTNVAWVGISVTADIDLTIRPHRPLVSPPENLKNGYVLSYPGDVPTGYSVVSRYHGAWLLCCGVVCAQNTETSLRLKN